MRTRTKVWLIIAASLVLIGCILFAGVMSSLGWDFTKLSTVKYETNIYEINEAFDSISMNADTADIVFAFSDDGKCTVECHEEAKAKHSVYVENGTLNIELIDERPINFYIGLRFSSPKIRVCLPKAEYAYLFIHGDTGDIEIPKEFMFKDVDISLSTGNVDFYASALEMVKIKSSTGYIHTENTTAGALDLSVFTGDVNVSSVSCEGEIAVLVSTGEVILTDIACKSVLSSGSTGSISLDNVIAAEKLSIERSTGDVKFEHCDAAEIFVKTDTGDVFGTLLSDKIFITNTDIGTIDVPKSTTGGLCEVTTDTGDIKLNIK